MSTKAKEKAVTSPVNAPAIRYARGMRELTQYQLADAAKISHPTVQRAERGEDNLTRPMMAAIARALAIPLDVIYDDPISGLASDGLQQPAWAVDMELRVEERARLRHEEVLKALADLSKTIRTRKR